MIGLLRIVVGFVYTILLGCLSNYVYDHFTKPLKTPPVDAGTTTVTPSLGLWAPPPAKPSTPPIKDIELPKLPITLPDQTNAKVYASKCEIPGQEPIEFRIVIFSESYSWVFKEDDHVQIVDRILEDKDFEDRLRTPGMQEMMDKASELIAVGTASCEGEEPQEEERALNRALKLREWIEHTRSWGDRNRPQRSLHVLNLGHWKGGHSSHCEGSPESTWHQRKVLLMAVRAPSAKTDLLSKADLQQCIRKSLGGDPRLDQLLGQYSRFDLDRKLTGEDI